MQLFNWQWTREGGDARRRIHGHLDWESLPWVECDSSDRLFFEGLILPLELTSEAVSLVREYTPDLGALTIEGFIELRDKLEEVQSFPATLLPGNGFLPVHWSVRRPERNRNFFFSSLGTIVSSDVRDAWIESGLSGLAFIPVESSRYERTYYLIRRLYHYVVPGDEFEIAPEYEVAFGHETSVEISNRPFAKSSMPDYFTADEVVVNEKARDLLIQFDPNLSFTVHELPPFREWRTDGRCRDLWCLPPFNSGQSSQTISSNRFAEAKGQFSTDDGLFTHGEIFHVEFLDGAVGFGVKLPFGNFGELECVIQDSTETAKESLGKFVHQWDDLCREVISRLWECDELDDLIEDENAEAISNCTLFVGGTGVDGESIDFRIFVDLGTSYQFDMRSGGVVSWQPLL